MKYNPNKYMVNDITIIQFSYFSPKKFLLRKKIHIFSFYSSSAHDCQIGSFVFFIFAQNIIASCLTSHNTLSLIKLIGFETNRAYPFLKLNIAAIPAT